MMTRNWAISVILTSLLTTIYCVHFLDDDRKHLAVCYNDTQFTVHNMLPPKSLESLLSIIERIEYHHSFSNKAPEEVAAFIIRRFRQDGILKRDNEDRRGNAVRIIMNQLNTNLGPINFLTADEMCGLHWMLSHDVNTTVMDEERNDLGFRPTSEPNRRRRNINEVRTYSHFPRESGVMFTPSGETVAPGSLLAAIAMMKQTHDVTLKSYFPYLQQSLASLTINKMHAVSYGINLALPTVTKPLNMPNTQPNTQNLLGPNGIWNDTMCPTQYTLLDRETSATDAVLYGGFDGFFIANHLQSKINFRPKLSQILRMYYTDGFPAGRLVRSCKRRQNIENLINDGSHERNEVERQIARAILFLSQVGSGIQTEDAAHKAANDILKDVLGYLNKGSSMECLQLDTNSQPKFTPTVDLYVVLDRRLISQGYYETAKFLTYLANFLDIAPNASHIGAYVDDNKLFSSFFPLNASQSGAEWKCNVKYYYAGYVSMTNADDTADTIRSLKEIFKNDKFAERDRNEKPTAPGKVVLFVRTSNVPNHDSVVWEMELFRKDHPEIKILGAGKSHTEVQSYVPDKADFIQFSSINAMEAARRIVDDHLKKVANIIYIPYCEKERSYHEYFVYLPPFSVQYHMLPSTMFNLSSQLKLEVKAFGTQLKVCIMRNTDIFKIPTPGSAKCEDVAAGGVPTFWVGDPCSDYSAGYCPPIYIQVKRAQEAENVQPCTKNLCRTFEDAQYAIQVTDSRCGGCNIQLAISLFLTCLFALFWANL